MSDTVIQFDGEVDSYMKVRRADGSVRYFHNTDGESVEITEDEYLKAGCE